MPRDVILSATGRMKLEDAWSCCWRLVDAMIADRMMSRAQPMSKRVPCTVLLDCLKNASYYGKRDPCPKSRRWSSDCFGDYLKKIRLVSSGCYVINAKSL
jgi:hypothetical protein